MYFAVERKDGTETRHKLVLIAKGTFAIKKVDRENKTVLLERPEKTVENVYRSHVVLAPKGPSSEKRLEATRLMIINEVIVEFPAPEQDNVSHIRRNASDDESDKVETQRDEVEQEEPSEVLEEDMEASEQDEEDQV